MKYVASLLVALLLNATANLMMKAGMLRVDQAGGLNQAGMAGAVKTVITSPILMTGLVCFGLNAVFYMIALQKVKISLAYPVMVGGGYAIIATVAFWLLRERLTAGQWIGVALVLVGVILIAVQATESPPAGA
jgi:small multidrug resistance pump